MKKQSFESKAKIAGVVVLYNPDNDVIDNISSYIDQIELLFAVDNSDVVAPVIERLKENKKIIYISNNGNLGIAKALNIGATNAIELGCDFLLTMDQDSSASTGMIDEMLRCLEEQDIPKVGIVSPIHLIGINVLPEDGRGCEDVLTVWTSGNLLNLNVYKEVGPFFDELFIDFVDHEYCMRLNHRGYRVVQSCKAVLNHRIGQNIKKHKLLHLSLISSNHSHIRRYYITRNRFFVNKIYKKIFPEFYIDDMKKFLAEIITILLFEDHKFSKIGMIIKGYIDFVTGKIGRIDSRISVKQVNFERYGLSR